MASGNRLHSNIAADRQLCYSVYCFLPSRKLEYGSGVTSRIDTIYLQSDTCHFTYTNYLSGALGNRRVFGTETKPPSLMPPIRCLSSYLW